MIFRLKLLLFLFLSTGLYAQNKVQLSGKITDEASGEALYGASIYIKETASGVISSANGAYTVSLVPGTYNLKINFLGYEPKIMQVKLEKSMRMDIKLTSNLNALSEVVVREKRGNRQITRNTMSSVTMSIESIKNIPTLMGEADVIKALQLLPGVIMASEGSSGFSVRGGSPDQNYILLDGSTVYNPSHAMGFFSVFNNDIVQNVTIYKGDMPSQYGGRLSSVVDVEMRQGDMNKFGVEGGIGLLSSRLMVQGPIWKERTSFAVAARRTYFDIFLPLSSDEMAKDVKMYFYDLNAKITHVINEKNRLYFSGYNGSDIFETDIMYLRMNYGNTASTLRWNHIFSDNFFVNTSLHYSKYSYFMGGAEKDAFTMDWKSQLTDYGGRMDYTWRLNPKNALKFGLSSFYHHYEPGKATMNILNMGFIEGSSTHTMSVSPYYALENGVYLENDQKIGARLQLKYGLRLSSFSNIGPDSLYQFNSSGEVISAVSHEKGEFYHTYFRLEPKLAATYLIDSSTSLKASYARSFQYSQLAQNSTAGNPTDVWFPANPYLLPQQSDQIALGVFKNFFENELETSIEGYYKFLNNVVDFRDRSNVVMNKYLYGEVATGKGWAYGLEFMLKKAEGNFNGWVSYTLSKSERTVAEINNGNPYLAPYDRPHAVNVVLNYKPVKKHEFSANWVFYSGNPVTLPSGKAVIDGVPIPVYTDRNGYRMPNYHRLDVSYTFHARPRKKYTWDLVVGFYNVYNRKNPWMISFKQEESDPSKSYAEMIYLFGIVPSVTFNFKF